MKIYDEFEIYNNNSDNIIINALNFINSKFKHNGNSGMPKRRDVDSILIFALKRNNEINCRLLSILLADLLCHNKIKATHITCLPKEEFFDDCHVVVEAYLHNGYKIMLDPSFNLYFCDDKAQFLSTKEVITAFKQNKQIFYCKEARHNADKFDFDWYKKFMLINSSRFQRPEPYDADDMKGRLQLWNEGYNWNHKPVGFTVTKNEDKFWNF